MAKLCAACVAVRRGFCPVQDALDLIEFVTGPANSEWGSLRAKMGRSNPWPLNYFAIGNEVIHMLQPACMNTYYITLACHAALSSSSFTLQCAAIPVTAGKAAACVCNCVAAFPWLLVLTCLPCQDKGIFACLKKCLSRLLHADHVACNTAILFPFRLNMAVPAFFTDSVKHGTVGRAVLPC